MCCEQADSGRRYGLSVLGVLARFMPDFGVGEERSLRVAMESGLAEYDDFEGIAWRWQSIDGAMMKASMAQSTAGPPIQRTGEKMGTSVICWWMVVASRPVVARRDRR